MAIFGACLVAALGVALSASMAQAASTSEFGCTLYAAPGGLDAGPGTLDKPYGSVERMADRLRPGDVGCLRGGNYTGDVTVARSGQAGSPIVIRSAPNEIATITGRLVVDAGADFVTVAFLNLDGRNSADLPSPTVNASDVRFLANNVTNFGTAICFDLGSLQHVYRVSLEQNRIHHCGQRPATNLQHGIYVEHATDVAIVGNVIHDNADRGVQLYPDAHRAHVASNVIDGNGEGVLIGGGEEPGGSWTSSGNVIEYNLITFSRERYNVESFWGGESAGADNVVRRNCIFGGARDHDRNGLAPEQGFSAADNLFADPLYEDHDAGDYRLRADSPCMALEPQEPVQETAWVTPAPTGPDLSASTQLAALASAPATGVAATTPPGKPKAIESTLHKRPVRIHRRTRTRKRKPARRAGNRRHERPCPACGRAFAG